MLLRGRAAGRVSLASVRDVCQVKNRPERREGWSMPLGKMTAGSRAPSLCCNFPALPTCQGWMPAASGAKLSPLLSRAFKVGQRRVLRGMGLTHLAKNEHAKEELAEKGMSMEQS